MDHHQYKKIFPTIPNHKFSLQKLLEHLINILKLSKGFLISLVRASNTVQEKSCIFRWWPNRITEYARSFHTPSEKLLNHSITVLKTTETVLFYPIWANNAQLVKNCMIFDSVERESSLGIQSKRRLDRFERRSKAKWKIPWVQGVEEYENKKEASGRAGESRAFPLCASSLSRFRAAGHRPVPLASQKSTLDNASRYGWSNLLYCRTAARGEKKASDRRVGKQDARWGKSHI